MPCPTCNATTKDGHPCRHKTCKYAPRCAHHTQVQVRPSQIAGRGLFAKEPIRKGAVVADYTHGTQALTQAQFDSKYPSGRASHVWRHPSGTYYDAHNLNRSVAGSANRAPQGKKPNAVITGGGKLKTRRSVRPGEELTVSYGRGYRL